MRLVAFSLLAVLVVGIPATTWASGRYALVVGHNHGSQGEEPLAYAEDDARRFAQALIAVGGVDKRDLTLLTHPTQAEVEAGFEKLMTRASAAPDGVALFYFAGHGDESNLHLGNHRLSRAEVMDRMKRLPTRAKVAIIDACQTPAPMQRRGVQAGPSFEIGILAPETPRGVALISSSNKGEPALESKNLRGALFTHHFLSGLRGAADADRDGRITLSEVYAYARRLTVLDSATAADVVQNPSFHMDLSGAEDLVLAETSRSRARLVLPRGELSRYLVFHKSTASVVAEVEGHANYPLTIAVPAGRLLIQRRGRTPPAVAEVEAPFGGTRALEDSDFRPAPQDVLTRRGQPVELWPAALFGSAHGRLDAIDASPVWRLGPALRYEHRGQGWVVGMDAEATFAHYRDELLETREQVAALAADLGWRLRTTALAFSLGLGPVGQITFQQRERRDTDRLAAAGLPEHIEARHTALGLGGRLAARVDLPLSERLELRLGLDMALLGERLNTQDEEAQLMPVLVVGVSLGLGLRL